MHHRIIIDHKSGVPMVTMSTGNRLLSEIVKIIVRRDKVNISELQTAAGLSHPTLYRVIAGNSRSVRAMLSALDILGYDIILVKRKK